MANNIFSKVATLTTLSGFFAMTSSAQATILFSESQTGVELFNNSDVTFPSVSPVINGSSIDFGTGTAAEALLVWDLLPAAPRGDLDISIAIDYTPLTSDNDPYFAIFDGSNYFGLARLDNTGASMDGLIYVVRGSATATEILNRTIDSIPLTGVDSVQPFSYDLWIADGGTGPASLNNFVEGPDSAAGPFSSLGNFINTDNPLKFIFYRDIGNNGGPEQYRINSIAIEIEEKDIESVPEPSTIFGLGLALGLGALSLKRKQKKCTEVLGSDRFLWSLGGPVR
ncbi:MAG: PEP-CTERM sorting domain-containing protein [Xenococcaceae cyanobacterium]